MLEGWLAGVLQEKLGNYLELGKEQLRMGLWKGDLVLRNIQLKPVEVQDWPFRVVGGQLQKLTIHIPWQALSSTSAVLTVDELVVVVSFRGAITQEDREAAKQRQLIQKRQLCALPVPSVFQPAHSSYSQPRFGPCALLLMSRWPLGGIFRRLASEEALYGSAGSAVRRGKGGANYEPEVTGGDGSFKQRLLQSIMANLVVQVCLRCRVSFWIFTSPHYTACADQSCQHGIRGQQVGHCVCVWGHATQFDHPELRG